MDVDTRRCVIEYAVTAEHWYVDGVWSDPMKQTTWCGEHKLQPIVKVKVARRIDKGDAWEVRGRLACGHRFGAVMTHRNYVLAKVESES